MKSEKVKFRIIHHVDQKTINEMYDKYTPIFILSTGRSGSKFVAELLNLSPNISAFHEPRPSLQYFSNFAYHHQREEKNLTNIVNAARMELLLEIFIKNKIYVESNQCLSFFAPVLAKLFKKSKFIHLIRHPGDFIRSAIRKGWHKNDSIWESGRVKMTDKKLWHRLDHIEKLAWVWNSTNKYIENFKQKIEKKRIIDIRIEDLSRSNEKIHLLWKFTKAQKINFQRVNELINLKINKLKIRNDEPANIRKISEYPLYRDWNPEMKKTMKKTVKNLASLYQYDL